MNNFQDIPNFSIIDNELIPKIRPCNCVIKLDNQKSCCVHIDKLNNAFWFDCFGAFPSDNMLRFIKGNIKVVTYFSKEMDNTNTYPTFFEIMNDVQPNQTSSDRFDKFVALFQEN